MKRLILLIFIALVFFSTPAQAEDTDIKILPCCVEGAYISGNIGVTFLPDSEFEFFGAEVAQSSHDPGFNIGGAVGYDFGNIRAEFEVTFRTAQWDEFAAGPTVPGCPCTGPDDDHFSATSFMVNGFYDFNIENSRVVPYLGTGLGGANVRLDGNDTGLTVVDTDFVFAYQFMGGVGFEVTPSTTLTLGYRYFATTNPNFDIFLAPGSEIQVTIDAHEIVAGARFTF